MLIIAFFDIWWLLREPLCRSGIKEWTSLATIVLRDGLGTLTDCVLCEFSWKEQSGGCLYLAGADSGLLVVVG